MQDLEDGRLAGAVPAEQCVDLALGRLEIDAMQGADAAEAHVDVAHAHRVSGSRSCSSQDLAKTA